VAFNANVSMMMRRWEWGDGGTFCIYGSNSPFGHVNEVQASKSLLPIPDENQIHTCLLWPQKAV